MPVTVKCPGPRETKAQHTDGTDVAVDEGGNLVVTAREDRAERVVAIYAAGAWTSAEAS